MAEAAFWKGTSQSKVLFELVLRLKCFELKHNITLHVAYVSGKPKVSDWLQDVSRGLDFELLTRNGWFDNAHKPGNFIWTDPPVAAKVVIKQLGFICLKRPNSMHLIVVLRLMTG